MSPHGGWVTGISIIRRVKNPNTATQFALIDESETCPNFFDQSLEMRSALAIVWLVMTYLTTFKIEAARYICIYQSVCVCVCACVRACVRAWVRASNPY